MRNIRRKKLPALSHLLQSVNEALRFRNTFLCTAMLVFEETREMLLGLYRESPRLSRELVGRAVVLDGGALGSGGLGPATLFTRQVVREGPGPSASWCLETCCVGFL